MDRRRYDSAMFWVPFGTAAAVIGLALMTIGVTRLPANASMLSSPWFDGGLGLALLGGLLLLWSLWLFLGHRRHESAGSSRESTLATQGDAKQAMYQEGMREYYKEREKLIDVWERQQKDRHKK